MARHRMCSSLTILLDKNTHGVKGIGKPYGILYPYFSWKYLLTYMYR